MKRVRKRLMRLIPSSILKKWYQYKATRLYDRKVEEAELHMRKYNRRTFLVTAGINDLALVTREGWRSAKRKGYVDNISMGEIRRVCVYCTATPSGTEEMGAKEKKERRIAFLRWYTENTMRLSQEWLRTGGR